MQENEKSPVTTTEVKTEDPKTTKSVFIESKNSGTNVFLRRLGAYFVDGLITGVVYTIIYVLATLLFFIFAGSSSLLINQSNSSVSDAAAGGLSVLIITGLIVLFTLTIILDACYYSYFESSNSQGTFGKQIFGIKVVKEDLSKITFKDGLLRYVIKFFSIYFTGGLIFFIALLTDKNQNLHDIVAKTLVVKK
jgi:uncharacterized RDD family membrane protein YckC